MKILPIAFDSLGTRGMATYVETSDLKLFIDPAVALAPNRNGYPPHPLELQREAEQWEQIQGLARQCQVLIVTHYHYDHHNPDAPEIFNGKIALVKHPLENVNKSGMARSRQFLSAIKPERLEYCDGRSFSFGKTKIEFSRAVFHGVNNKLGYVVEVLVDDGREKFLHTSDVEGPAVEDQVEFILRSKPHTLFVDGPMSHMLGYRYPEDSLKAAIVNLMRVLRECPVKRLVLDHHLLRDKRWRERMGEVLAFGGNKVCCAAEFLGKQEDVLENRRKELFREFPVH